MVDEKRKTTVPIPPVGADGEQPISNESTGIISGGEGEINSSGEISQENFLEFQRLYDRLNNPAYLHTVTLLYVLILCSNSWGGSSVRKNYFQKN